MEQTRLHDNITKLRQRVRLAEENYQRSPHSGEILAVSKTRPAADIRAAHAEGLHAFGENYLQEALGKQEQLQDLAICWHFIGPIQSNKTRPIAAHFDWVHSVDRARVARRLNEQRPAELPPLQVCLQVNISGEQSKSGVAPEAVPELAATVQELPRLRLRGLMAIPSPCEDFDRQRRPFARLRLLLEELRGIAPELDTLSMGMSADLEAAIAEGATLIRIGTDIFGPRE